MNLTPAGSIKIMVFLYNIGAIDAFTLVQFIQNAVTQYGVGVAINTVGKTIQPSMLVEPIVKTVTTGVDYLTASGIDPTERAVRVAQVAVFSSVSAVASTTDPATNVGIAGANAAFLAYMMEILEAANHTNIPFILPFKNGQGKVFLILAFVGTMSVILVYATKKYLELLKSSYNFGLRLVDKMDKIFKRPQKVQFIRLY